jgi:23S rRNA (pseudouridine1915-N3)-methyltransferase
MKNIKIIAIGKDRSKDINSLIQEYLKRTRWKIEIIELTPSKTLEPEQQKIYEADLILSKILPKSFAIALDERGATPSSVEFAEIIDKTEKEINFIIGGANGLANIIREKSDRVISFGRLTYPHMIVRMLLIEQIYRAYTICNNHPYNK